MDAWRASGIVTLLTDFGLRDPYVGVMKGVLLREAPRLRAMVDLTHEVPPQDVRVGAFLLARSWSWFPAGTVHLAVVDPGVGTSRDMLLATRGGHAFVAPDNGLLGAVLDDPEGGAVPEVGRFDAELLGIEAASSTFHGRDLFAPAAGRLAAGVEPAALREPCDPAGCVRIALPEPRPTERGGFRGEVLVVDRFGNLVTNVDVGRLRRPGGSGWTVRAGGRELRVVESYGHAAANELVALLGSYDLIEVAQRDGDAARALGLGAGDPIEIEPHEP